LLVGLLKGPVYGIKLIFKAVMPKVAPGKQDHDEENGNVRLAAHSGIGNLRKTAYITAMSFSLADILFVVVIFQLLFTSGFLFTHRGGRRVGNRLLAAFFLTIGLDLLDNLLLIKGIYSAHPAFALWSSWLLLLFGPLLYLYTQSVLFRDFRLTARKWLHFLPFLVLFLASEILWQAQGSAGRTAILERVMTRRVTGYQVWGPVLIFLSFFFYMVGAMRLIGRFKKVAGEEYSDYRRIDIGWLSNTLLFFSLTMVVAALNSLIGMTSLAAYWWPVFLGIILLVFIYINVVLLKALRHPELFALLEERAAGPAAVKEAAPTADVADMADRKRVLEQLAQYMMTQRPWLDADLTLEQLAGKLGLRPKVLSRAINEGLGRNFFELVNHYRIEEAKRLLTDPADKKITVLEVLYEVGFNSKSSFNTLFKQDTGMTPSEFKKSSQI
jgi:AraC-like DNA-binding protein